MRIFHLSKLLAMLATLSILCIIGCTPEETKPTAGTGKDSGEVTGEAGKKKKIVFVFKIGGISYSEACKAGATQANDDPELNVEVQYQAATEGTSEKQRDIIEQAIVGKADAIVVSPVDAKAIVPSLQSAVEKGVRVFTWDSDAPESPREFYVAAVDDVQIGVDIADALAKEVGEKGKVLIFSGQKTAENLNLHVDGAVKGFQKYPNIKVGKQVYYNDDATDKAKSVALAALQANPDTVGIACMNSVSPRGAAEALRTLKKVGKVKVWGLGLPTENNTYLKDGSITGLYLWDPQKLTYMTAKMVKMALDNKAPKDGDSLPEGKIMVNKGIVTLPLRLDINKDNVDTFKF